MFLNAQKAVDEGWLRGVDPSDVQPNAVDIAVTGISEVNKNADFALMKDSKKHRGVNVVQPQDGEWILDPGHAYDFTSPAYVEVPKGVVGWYDSGFKGHVCGILYNLIGTTYMEVESRVAQFIMAPSDSVGMYAGGYNTGEGQQWHGK